MLVVFVNGRPVKADIVQLNVDEGWVDIEDVSAMAKAPEEEGKVGDEILSTQIKLPTKRLLGKVTVKVLDDTD